MEILMLGGWGGGEGGKDARCLSPFGLLLQKYHRLGDL